MTREPSLRDAWEHEADHWLAWARTPGHDHYFWRYNLPRFLDFLPPPGGATVDIGCGEGRLGRILAARGYDVVGVDSSPTLARAARTDDDAQPVVVGDAAGLPLRSGFANLAVAFMSLQDIDDLTGAVREAARILRPGGVWCLANLHPLVTAGEWADGADDAAFVISGRYTGSFRFAETIERDGIVMTFHSVHRPLAAYTDALADAGFLIEALSEPIPTDDHVAEVPAMARHTRVPNWLYLRAVLARPPR